MSYVEKLLTPGERVLHRTRRHGIVLLRGVAGALVLIALGLGAVVFFGVSRAGAEGSAFGLWAGAAIALVGLLAGLPGYLRWRTEEYLVTDRRVLQSEGILHKRVLDSSLEKVNDVLFEQTLAGRVLGYGTIRILTASEEGVNQLDTIPDPLAFKRAMLASKAAGSTRDASGPAA